jgi:hypothetical protein
MKASAAWDGCKSQNPGARAAISLHHNPPKSLPLSFCLSLSCLSVTVINTVVVVDITLYLAMSLIGSS